MRLSARSWALSFVHFPRISLSSFLYETIDQDYRTQEVFSTFPELEEYSSKDLFSKHPTKSGLWRYEGRTDDVIVLTNGRKLHPGELENTLNAHDALRAAILYGEGRPQAALLIEANSPPETEEGRVALLEDICPSIERFNYITKCLIVFTAANKPMLRGVKGSIQRKMTIEMYSSELDQAYVGHAKASRD